MASALTSRTSFGRLLALAAVAWLVVAQILAGAHGASPEGLAPGHDKAACAWCVTGDRTGDGLIASGASLPAPLLADAPTPGPSLQPAARPYDLAAAPRGPPGPTI